MTEKLASSSYEADDLHLALQQMLPPSTDEEGDDVKALTEEYRKYKMEYVKHLFFNPDNENLCKCF